MERAPTFRAVSIQGWHDLTFLHWAYPPDVVQALLAPGLRVHTAEGSAWVGVTPFRMHAVRPVGLPPVPHLSSFPEVNCRTYVQHPNGTAGIWFFSLDTPRLWIIAALRSMGLPYMWARARMGVDPPGQPVARRAAYLSRRLLPRPGGSQAPGMRVEVEVGRRLDRPDPLAVFLTARWWAFTSRAGRLWQVPVAHPDWPLHRARAVVVDVGALVRAAGLPAPQAAALVHFSPGVRTRLGLPRES
ncbi:DUF2071 domain-containing protein [Georgenia sp. H159]|uniref:YqjF family protein n=1 Tax=Georgenia sp. H159 TaxID=3076115 RepID=UPI002D790C20|nr:DUF2071 domain-containing protein [Georgenia sp. H159]